MVHFRKLNLRKFTYPAVSRLGEYTDPREFPHDGFSPNQVTFRMRKYTVPVVPIDGNKPIRGHFPMRIFTKLGEFPHGEIH